MMFLSILLTAREIEQLKTILNKQVEHTPALKVALAHPIPDLTIQSMEILGLIEIAQINANYPKEYESLKKLVIASNKAHSVALEARINSAK